MKKIIPVIFLLLLIFPVALYYTSGEEIQITVTDKERITKSSGKSVESKYLIFTDEEVFENVDAMTFFKFNSSDIQGHLHQDSTYNVKVVGWRVPFLSMYRNIIKVQK